MFYVVYVAYTSVYILLLQRCKIIIFFTEHKRLKFTKEIYYLRQGGNNVFAEVANISSTCVKANKSRSNHHLYHLHTKLLNLSLHGIFSWIASFCICNVTYELGAGS